MKKRNEVKVCKNKKCQKVLPADYKYKYCEACRNQQAQNAKKWLQVLGAGLGTVACAGVAIITKGKVNLKK